MEERQGPPASFYRFLLDVTNRLPQICFVAPNTYPLLAGDEQLPVIGGAELQQAIVSRALVERGYAVSMICRDFGQDEQVEVDGIRVFRTFKLEDGIPILRFFWPRLTSIWRCLANADADIYYQRSASMLTGVVAAFCRRAGKKSIFAAAGNPDLERATSRIRYARDRLIYEYGLRHVDRILVQNDEQERLCQLNFGRRATQIPNCYPAPSSPSSGTGQYVLWVSTIRALKRPELFLDLAEALPGRAFRMIGGPGRGEEALFESVMARAVKIANLEFLGFVPYNKIDDHFDDASVFVNTSTSEGFPNTFLQAWARGVPTISFIDSGARAEGHPVGCQVDSVSAMAERLASWLANPVERSSEGQRCRAYFEGNHSPSQVLHLYEELFRELLPGTRR